MLIDFDHGMVEVERPVRLQGIYKRDVRVGNNVWIGYGACILRGVTVGDNAVIGTSAVVTQRRTRQRRRRGGVPARVIRMREAPRADALRMSTPPSTRPRTAACASCTRRPGSSRSHWEALAPRFAGTDARRRARGRRRAAPRRCWPTLKPLTEARGLYGGPAAQRGRQSPRRIALAAWATASSSATRRCARPCSTCSTWSPCSATRPSSRTRPGRRGPGRARCARHERQLLAVERAGRRAVVKLGRTPTAAIEPLDPSTAGRAAHGAPNVTGSVGEWVDRDAAARSDRLTSGLPDS